MKATIESLLKRLCAGLLCIFFSATFHSAYGQVPEPIPYASVETMPSFMGAGNDSPAEFRYWIEDRLQLMKQDPNFYKDWDEKYGDRMQKIVFIGQHMDKEQIIRDLDACLE